MIDADGVAAVRDIERSLLLDPDVGLLPVYADALEDAGLGYEPWREDSGGVADYIRRLASCYSRPDPPTPDIVPAEVLANGLMHLSRRSRLAWAAVLNTTHPMESVELRLSVATGRWPGMTTGQQVMHGRLWAERHVLAGAQPSWHVGDKLNHPASTVWTTSRPYWATCYRPERPCIVHAEDATAVARDAASRWIEETLR